jgi:hypothetical protein
MTVQEFSNTIAQNALGRTILSPIVRPLVIGFFNSLPTSSYGKIATANQSTLSSLGLGKGSEVVALALNSGLTSVDYYPCAQSAAGSGSYSATSGSFTCAGNLNSSATGSVVPVLSGTPLDDYLIRLEILAGGTQASVPFRYSVDDGNNWQKTVVFTGTTIPLLASNAFSTSSGSSGLSVTFPTGTYVKGDVWNSTARAAFPLASSTGSPAAGSIEGGLSAVSGSAVKYTHVYIAGQPCGSTDSSNATAFSTEVANAITLAGTLDTAGTPLEVILEAPRKSNGGSELDTTYQATITGSIATNLDSRVVVGYGHSARNAQLQSCTVWRNSAYTAFERIIKNNNPATSIYTDNAVPVASVQAAANSLYTNLDYTDILGTGATYDEIRSVNANGGTLGAANAAGFLSLYRSPYSSVPGSYTFLGGNTHADPTNDFFELVYAQQFNEFRIVIATWLHRLYKGQQLDTKKDGTGTLTEAQCRAIEGAIQQKVNTILVDPGYIPAAPTANGTDVTTFITVDRTQNVVSTSTLRYSYRMWVNAYVKQFTGVGTLAL